MKSPFPGMDPFMELRWLDVHNRLISYIGDQLQDDLPPDLRTQIGERVVMEFADEIETRPRPGNYPDVSVVEDNFGGTAVAQATRIDRQLAAPDLIVREEFALPESETYIEIVDAETGSKVVTVIELISPTNKLPGKGRESYLSKQASCLQAGVHFVEIDLTRQGDRRALIPRLSQELPLPHPAYLAVVNRYLAPPDHPQREYHQLPLEKSLKPIRIPLRPKDEDVILRMQPLIELAYQKGRYDRLDYTRRLNPPLSFAEQAFLEHCLAARQQS